MLRYVHVAGGRGGLRSGIGSEGGLGRRGSLEVAQRTHKKERHWTEEQQLSGQPAAVQ